MQLSFVATARLRKLACALATSPIAIAAACLAWVVSQQEQTEDQVLVTIDDDEATVTGSVVLCLTIHGDCTLAGLAASAATQLKAGSEHAMQLAKLFAAMPNSMRGVHCPCALAVSSLRVPMCRQPPLAPALLLSLPVKGAAMLHSFSGSIDCEALGRLARRISLCAAFAPDRPLVDAPLMDAAEAHFLAIACNRTAADWGVHHSVHASFRAAVVARPTAIALRTAKPGISRQEELTLTYAELDENSGALCEALLRLARHTFSPERRLVCLIFERSAAMVVALLGVLKAGAGYLPIQPTDPVTRISMVLAEAIPAAVLMGVMMSHCDGTGSHVPAAITNVDGALAAVGAPLAMPLSSSPSARILDPSTGHASPMPAHADDTVYVMYTSGSTGRPKGVIATHGPLLKRISWMRRAFPIGACDYVPFKTQVERLPLTNESARAARVTTAHTLAATPRSRLPSGCCRCLSPFIGLAHNRRCACLCVVVPRSPSLASPSGSSSTLSPLARPYSSARMLSCASRVLSPRLSHAVLSYSSCRPTSACCSLQCATPFKACGCSTWSAAVRHSRQPPSSAFMAPLRAAAQRRLSCITCTVQRRPR